MESTSNRTGRNAVVITLVSDKLVDPLSHLVSLLEDRERWRLAATCKTLHRVVEDYCSVAIGKIVEEHKVDDTFQERLLARTNGRREVSYRYLLRAAKCTYLYKLEMMQGTHEISGKAVLSEDGNRLVMAGTHPDQPSLFIYIWDLVNKVCLRADQIPASRQEHHINNVFVMGEHIVVCTNQRILVLMAETGNIVHRYSHPKHVDSSAQQDEAVLVFGDCDRQVFSFDIRTGSAQILCQLKLRDQIPPLYSIRAVLNSRWLVVFGMALVVFDLSNGCRQTDVFRGERDFHLSIQLARDRPNVIYTCTLDTFQVLEVSASGKFSTIARLKVPLGHDGFRGSFESRSFFEKNRYAYLLAYHGEPSLAVQNTKNGTTERILKVPAGHVQSSVPHMTMSNRRELFVGFEPTDRHATAESHGVVIAAYLANKHY